MESLLLIPVGCSGSGKSYLEKELRNHFENFVNVEPDDLRRKLWGDVNEQKNGHVIFRIAKEQIDKAAKENKLIYFNATNVSYTRNEKMIPEGINILYIFMMDSLDFDLCLNRVISDISTGKDRSRVPADVIQKQCINFKNCMKDVKANGINFVEYKGKIKQLISKIEEIMNG